MPFISLSLSEFEEGTQSQRGFSFQEMVLVFVLLFFM